MTFSASRITCALLLCAFASVSSRADSSTSSASSAGSASVGSLSDSVTSVSGSSTSNVAEGDYRIVEVAASDRPGALRLKLQPLARAEDAAAAIHLDVPRLALGDREAAPGGVVGVRQRPYGYEFAWADTRVAFYLALAPDWHRDLEPRPVPL